jgi:hypothetical protein
VFTRRLAEINLPFELVGASRPKIQPTVLTHAEVLAVINKMHGTPPPDDQNPVWERSALAYQ